MILQPGLRKAALVGHVTSSVGWLGAVAAFLVLAVVALHTADAATSRSLYVAMEVLGKAVLLPLAVASLVTGLVQSLGTPWGLFRHWWVIVKLALAVMSTWSWSRTRRRSRRWPTPPATPPGTSASCRRPARSCTPPPSCSSPPLRQGTRALASGRAGQAGAAAG